MRSGNWLGPVASCPPTAANVILIAIPPHDSARPHDGSPTAPARSLAPTYSDSHITVRNIFQAEFTIRAGLESDRHDAD